MEELIHAVIIIHETLFQHAHLIESLAVLLKDNKANRENQKDRQHAQKEALSDRETLHRLCIKIITKTKTRDNMLGIRTHLLAQARDIHINGTVEYKNILRPYPLNQLLTGEYASRLLEEKLQELVFRLCESYFLAVNLHRLAVLVNDQSFILHLMHLAGNGMAGPVWRCSHLLQD